MTIVHSFIGIVRQRGVRATSFLYRPAVWSRISRDHTQLLEQSLVNNRSHDRHSQAELVFHWWLYQRVNSTGYVTSGYFGVDQCVRG